MKVAQVPKNEQNSLKAQHEYNTPTLTDADFEDIAYIASSICHTPATLVCIIDSNGQWFKTFIGSGKRAADVFSPITDGTDNVFVVPDLSKDKRFSNHLLVSGEPHISFYVCVPIDAPGVPFKGILCIMDKVPGKLGKEQEEALKALGRQVAAQMEVAAFTAKQNELKTASSDLAKIAHIASHDLKSPLNNIISLTHLLKEDYGTKFDDEGNEYINYLNDAAYQLSDLCAGILNFARSGKLSVEVKEDIEMNVLASEVIGTLNVPAHVSINYVYNSLVVHTSKAALKQLITHLLQNGIKYLDTTPITINLYCSESDNTYIFTVIDNGLGIEKEEKEKIFALFASANGKLQEDDHMGIDLAIVKRLATKLGGTVTVDPEFSEGMSFTVTIPK